MASPAGKKSANETGSEEKKEAVGEFSWHGNLKGGNIDEAVSAFPSRLRDCVDE